MKKLLALITFMLLQWPSNDALAASLTDLNLHQTQQKLMSGEITLKQLKRHYLDRIERFDSKTDGVNAVAILNPQLDSRLKVLQHKIDHAMPLGSLFGAFVFVKDNVDISNMPNTAGSWLMKQHEPSTDAFVIQQLRLQDAIIIGKTNLSEWANFRSSMSSSGWSSLHGQTRNPHDLSRSPCGSSSGSGAAVAADFSLMAIGTETDGSVICPASVNGIVGFKPSLGLVSRSGIIPIAHSQDTAGPMARSVEDTYALFRAMVGTDSEDTMSIPPIDLPVQLKSNGLKGKRIGIVRNLMGYHPQVDQLFEQQLQILERAGATIVDKTPILTRNKWGKYEYIVLKSEFKADLNQYFKRSKAPLSSLEQLIELNQKHALRTMPIFGQEILVESQMAPALTEKTYLEALQKSKALAGEQGINATMKLHELDLLMAPSGAPAWKIDHVNGDHFLGSASSAAAVSGYPHITVPMGAIQHLPVGISFFGRLRDDVMLFEVALDYESRSLARLKPALR